MGEDTHYSTTEALSHTPHILDHRCMCFIALAISRFKDGGVQLHNQTIFQRSYAPGERGRADVSSPFLEAIA